MNSDMPSQWPGRALHVHFGWEWTWWNFARDTEITATVLSFELDHLKILPFLEQY